MSPSCSFLFFWSVSPSSLIVHARSWVREFMYSCTCTRDGPAFSVARIELRLQSKHKTSCPAAWEFGGRIYGLSRYWRPSQRRCIDLWKDYNRDSRIRLLAMDPVLPRGVMTSGSGFQRGELRCIAYEPMMLLVKQALVLPQGLMICNDSWPSSDAGSKVVTWLPDPWWLLDPALGLDAAMLPPLIHDNSWICLRARRRTIVITRDTMLMLTLVPSFSPRHAPLLTCGPMAHTCLSTYNERHCVIAWPTDCSTLAPHAPYAHTRTWDILTLIENGCRHQHSTMTYLLHSLTNYELCSLSI
jgi:hypothetical protein